jgi:hypothetical protein
LEDLRPCKTATCIPFYAIQNHYYTRNNLQFRLLLKIRLSMLYDCFHPCYSTTFGKSYCLALVLLSNTTRLPCHFWAIYALIRYTKTRFTANSTKILGFTILTLHLRKGSFCYTTCYTSLHSTKQDSLDLEFHPSLVYFSQIE